MSAPLKIYLGDSVYGELVDSWHGQMIKLTTDNGNPDDPRNVIYLEAQTLDAFLKWIDNLRTATTKPS